MAERFCPPPAPIFPRYIEAEEAMRDQRRKVSEPSVLIDSHCHLDFPDFAAERDAVVERARAAGAQADDHHFDPRSKHLGRSALIAEAYEDVFCTVGTHPHTRA